VRSDDPFKPPVVDDADGASETESAPEGDTIATPVADGPPFPTSPVSTDDGGGVGAKPPVEPIPPFPVPVEVYVGQVVTYHVGANYGDPGLSANGATELPAIVVRKWGPTTVNLQVLRDGPGPVWLTSVQEGTNPGQYSRH
jgi:hypothetical protein